MFNFKIWWCSTISQIKKSFIRKNIMDKFYFTYLNSSCSYISSPCGALLNFYLTQPNLKQTWMATCLINPYLLESRLKFDKVKSKRYFLFYLHIMASSCCLLNSRDCSCFSCCWDLYTVHIPFKCRLWNINSRCHCVIGYLLFVVFWHD